MRREDYQPEQTLEKSPFRKFKVSCLKCGSFDVRAQSQFDEDAGEIALVLVCAKCNQRERVPVKQG